MKLLCSVIVDNTGTDEDAVELKKAIKAKAVIDLHFPIVGSLIKYASKSVRG